MTALYLITAGNFTYGAFDAESEQDARDQAARDAGYKDEADIARQVGRPSELRATLLTGAEANRANAAAKKWPVWADHIDTAVYPRGAWEGMSFKRRRELAAQTIVYCR